MNPPKSAFYVVGHRNPDTDSLVSAHVLAWMYSQMGTPAQALRLGDPNPQSRWVFEQAGVELPMLREDCRPRVGEVCDPVRSVSPTDPLRKALRLIRERRVPVVPVLDDAGNVLGMIGEHSPRLN
ncbi:MAG: CBS domain-containing protein, partial [Puniceicoccales bacterium]